MFNSFLPQFLFIQLHKPKFLLTILEFSQHVKKITGVFGSPEFIIVLYQRPVDHNHAHMHLVSIYLLQDPVS